MKTAANTIRVTIDLEDLKRGQSPTFEIDHEKHRYVQIMMTVKPATPLQNRVKKSA